MFLRIARLRPVVLRAGVASRGAVVRTLETGITQRKPTIEEACDMPRAYHEFPNDVLLMMAANMDHDARQERLTREVMAVDKVSWEEAQPKVREIAAATHVGIGLAVAPFRVVIVSSIVVGLASFPLCFHLPTALWFNDNFVTADVASPADLETWLEVGSWTWNWMEPPLGQISFFLLCLQLARDQMQNIGKKSIADTLKLRRARTVAAKFPAYDRKVVEDFAETEFNNVR
ncbi:hypothetical protein CTAYLR_007087 [Chrysophaeum taylorii]|uniref:Uncharacterized protein n=1 Tax=Chrysophaeum taylorii TaxID=2483200 RepID=A0AAD7XNU0_9STRA|nr:hypothetical protein CTAYLR_007087 [Chrysophaeum taylorii]